jgi:hypothetical protein
MNPDSSTERASEIMLDFACTTGLLPATALPKRYLWTDAFAVCNFLELFRRTQDPKWRDLALLLVHQVHHTLGRYRPDDSRSGWISGLPEGEGEVHPTRGGLRIGKPLPERKPGEVYDERLEWDQDGQYFHYLTKWMHALNRVSRVTGERKYNQWAIELAQAAYAGFTYTPPSAGRMRMSWKMSTDLSRPLVPSMGQHDPLDGFVTFSELQETAVQDFGQTRRLYLAPEIAGIAEICRGSSLATDDPLGLGGLLGDALRVAQLMTTTGGGYAGLCESLLDASLHGIRSYVEGDTTRLPPEHRLAFRELGLAIGLAGTGPLLALIGKHPHIFGSPGRLPERAKAVAAYAPLGEEITGFWLDRRSWNTRIWIEHQEINMVMLATSLVPDGFLTI